MDVFISGIRFVSESANPSRIGIAITTRNCPEALKRTIEQHMKHLLSSVLVVVISNGSSPVAAVSVDVKLVRHNQSLGIAASKNASLTALVDVGCEHLFLWDDDAWPIDDNWHLPYIESPESRLAYQFLDFTGPRKINDMTVLYGDDEYIVYIGQHGVMLYYHRSAVDKVGGFDPVYGHGVYEHPGLVFRTHNVGLSTRVFTDVTGSEKLIHLMDEYEKGARSTPRPEREALIKANVVIYSDRRDNGYIAYVPFRRQCNVVITALLTSQDDPQRQVRMKASPELVQGWTTSIRGVDAVVLVDELDIAPKGTDLFKVSPLSTSPYFIR